MRFVFPVITICLLIVITNNAVATEKTYYRDVTLLLTGALFHGDPSKGQERKPKELELYLGRSDTPEGQPAHWDKHVLGWAGTRMPFTHADDMSRLYNQMDHDGILEEINDNGSEISLKLSLAINPDPWVPGGKAAYTLKLKRDGYGLSGTFEGTFNDHLVQGTVTGQLAEALWPAPVSGFKPLAPGEHPRLIFRAGDLPALRARAKTHEGQRVINILKEVLGGGEALPTIYSPSQDAYDGKTKNMPIGAYTLWHGMGFGFLYQITEDKKYAELARACVEKAMEGVRDRDPRYSYVKPGGKLRAGSSYAAIAMAYDLCYHVWDEPFRLKVAKSLQDKISRKDVLKSGEMALKEPTEFDLVFNTVGGQHAPWSNHYMAWNGGGGTALLAILGDPGVDAEIVERAHRVFRQRLKRGLLTGYGDSAYFYEGHHCGRLSTNTGMSSYLQALRVACGEDFVSPYTGGKWLLTKWVYEIVRRDGVLHNAQRGMYANPRFERGGMSSGGDFSQGFSIAPPEHRPALKWFYEHVIDPAPEHRYDTIRYPHRAVYAFVNWPFDVEARNPAEVLPKVLRGAKEGYYSIRSGWSGGEDDLVFDFLSTKYVRENVEPGMLLGMGINRNFNFPFGIEQDFVLGETGDTCIAYSNRGTIVGDVSGRCGAPMLLISIPRLSSDPQVQQKPVDAGEGASAADRLRARFLGKSEEPTKKPAPLGSAFKPFDGPEVTDDRAHVMHRRRHLNGYDLDLYFVQKGPAPKAELTGSPEEPLVLCGERTIGIKDGRVILGVKK